MHPQKSSAGVGKPGRQVLCARIVRGRFALSLGVAVIAAQWIQAATLPGPDSELAFETRHSRPLAFTGRSASWHVGSTTSSTAATLNSGHRRPLQFRFAYETKRDEVYLLTQTFTLWTNGIFHSTVTVPELLEGDGATHTSLSTIRPVSSDKVVTFKLNCRVLAQAPGQNAALGITRIALQPYRIACQSCSPGGFAGPGQPGPLLVGTHWNSQVFGPVNGGLLLRFNLGQSAFSLSAGELFLCASLPSVELCQPGALRVLTPLQRVTIVRDPSSKTLRQVISAECLVDILPLNKFASQIAFYGGPGLSSQMPGVPSKTPIPTNGLTCFVTWTIENPDGTSTHNRLRVIESSANRSITNTYSWIQATHTWELVSGNGLRTQTITCAWNDTRQVRTETSQTFDPIDNRLVEQHVAHYRQCEWGEALIEEIVGDAKDATTNHYSYFDRSSEPAFGRLQQAVRHDGSWERYEYDNQGRIKTRFLPFANTPPANYLGGRIVTYDYSPWLSFGDAGSSRSLQPRTITEQIHGITVKQAYFIPGSNKTIEIRCTAPSQVPFDAPALCTTNWFYPERAASAGRLEHIDYPDGTTELFRYALNSENRIKVVLKGWPNFAHTAILDGTKNLLATTATGHVLRREQYDLAPGRTNILTYLETWSYTDDLHRSHIVSFLDGTSNLIQYACCGLETVINRDGPLTTFDYDDLKRIKAESRLIDGLHPLTTIFTYDAANHLLFSKKVGTDGTEYSLGGEAFDTAGRPVLQTNAVGGVSSLAYDRDNEGRFRVSTVLPNRGIHIETVNADGSTHEIKGSAAHGLKYTYNAIKPGCSFVPKPGSTTQVSLLLK